MCHENLYYKTTGYVFKTILQNYFHFALLPNIVNRRDKNAILGTDCDFCHFAKNPTDILTLITRD